MAQQPKLGLGRLFFQFLDHTHPVGLLWTSDQLVAEAATYTTHNKHKIRNIHALSEIRTRDPSSQAAYLQRWYLIAELTNERRGNVTLYVVAKGFRIWEARFNQTWCCSCLLYTHSLAILRFSTRAHETPTSASSPTPLFTHLSGNIHHRHNISKSLA